jgi:hypothetical protein
VTKVSIKFPTDPYMWRNKKQYVFMRSVKVFGLYFSNYKPINTQVYKTKAIYTIGSSERKTSIFGVINSFSTPTKEIGLWYISPENGELMMTSFPCDDIVPVSSLCLLDYIENLIQILAKPERGQSESKVPS